MNSNKEVLVFFIKLVLFFLVISFVLTSWPESENFEECRTRSDKLYPNGNVVTTFYSKRTTSIYLKGEDVEYCYNIGTAAQDKLFYTFVKNGAYIERKGNVLKVRQDDSTSYWLINNCNGKFYSDPIRPEYFQDSILVDEPSNNHSK